MSASNETPTSSWLPPIGSWKYYALLGAVAIFILGPLGGVTAAYMNFSLGFFVGGQVLAGILGSAVTYGYGAEGKHGANYMQTMAASVAGMSGMAVLIQAMVWMGMPQPPAWQLVLYFLCIGMFGVGVGMLYTPFLVDKMRLMFPSGYAVANILRALTDKRLLQASIGKLGSGAGMGFIGGVLATKLASLGNIGLSTSTFGAGMVVGARIAVPAMVVGALGEELVPYLSGDGVPVPGFLQGLVGGESAGAHWLDPGAPFRKIGFIIALGTILGAAVIDISIVAYKTVQQLMAPKEAVAVVPGEEWKQTNTYKLVAWVVFWGAALFVVATQVMMLPALYVGVAMGLVFLFLVINGISTGVSDSNPISSAFVLSVFVLAFVGLTDPKIGLMCAAILLVATSIGVDMQQDRSTGWRLGSNRTIQFRFQTIGVVMGAVMAVAFASIFMSAYPYLKTNQYAATSEESAAAAAIEAAEAERVAARDGLIETARSDAAAAATAAASSREAMNTLDGLLIDPAADPTTIRETFATARAGVQQAMARAESASMAAASATASVAPPTDPAADAAAAAEAAELAQNQAKWASAMTYKFVGALESLTPPAVPPELVGTPEGDALVAKHARKKEITMTALWLGISIGFLMELLRKVIKAIPAYQAFAKSGKVGFATDFCLDSFFLPSPYASSFGGFVDFMVSVWFAAGGVLTSFAQTIEEEVKAPKADGAAEGDIPEDMSTTSLVGGGLIAGDSLAALALGIVGLLGALFA